MANATKHALAGVFRTVKKGGETCYRASITFKNKHISLGSFSDENAAADAYLCASALLRGTEGVDAYEARLARERIPLSFEKWVCLVNFRDNGMYFHNPIYLRPKYFYYYLSEEIFLIFDIDDLFYYSSHKIMARGNHYFVADYGSQINVRSRYGIMPFAVAGRDYLFKNGNEHDFRYGNIVVVNRYQGVRKRELRGRIRYRSYIHVRGEYLIGEYETELEAAIAYNKAADILKKNGLRKSFRQNEPDCPAKEYSEIYTRLEISEKLRALSFPVIDKADV